MFCSRCGLRLEEGTKFCQSCGQEVAVAVATGPEGVGVFAAPPARPAAPTAPLRYAGFWERFAAYLIDALILAIPFGIVLTVTLALLGGFGVLMRHRPAGTDQTDSAAAAAATAAAMGPVFVGFLFAYLIFLAVTWLYFAGMESSERQATFGKSLMALRVTNVEGQRISFCHATGRFFAKIVSGMIPFAIGYIMAAFTAKKQALHDLIAGTLVLRR